MKKNLPNLISPKAIKVMRKMPVIHLRDILHYSNKNKVYRFQKAYKVIRKHKYKLIQRHNFRIFHSHQVSSTLWSQMELKDIVKIIKVKWLYCQFLKK